MKVIRNLRASGSGYTLLLSALWLWLVQSVRFCGFSLCLLCWLISVPCGANAATFEEKVQGVVESVGAAGAFLTAIYALYRNGKTEDKLRKNGMLPPKKRRLGGKTIRREDEN